MMLVVGLSYIGFIILRYILSIPSFIKAFITKGCWILSKAFSAYVKRRFVSFVFASFNMLYYV
jgi:hypothetical protein